MQLTGSQRCAVFLLAMGEDVATDMLGRMQRQEVARITEAIASLPHVPESEVRTILREARIFLETQADGICADRALAGRLLAHCLGEREARETMRAWGPAESARPFESLERMRPGQLYQLLRQEHPQTLALVLGHLSASRTRSSYNYQRTCCFNIFVFAETIFTDNKRHIIWISLNRIMKICFHSQAFKSFAENICRCLSCVLGNYNTANIKSGFSESVDKSENISIISNAQISSDLIFNYIVSVDYNNYLCFVSHVQKHFYFAVRLKSRKNS